VHVRGGTEPLSQLRLIAVDSEGREHGFKLAEVLGAGETVDVALASFTPAPKVMERFREIRVAGLKSGIPFEATSPLQ
jgi:hypothetical protein